MQPDIRRFLFDAQEACQLLVEFTRGRSLDDYRSDALLRSAVERQLMIIGEALQQALKIEPGLAQMITDIRQVINFRHVLVHGYAIIEHETVWGILENELPTLHSQVQSLLSERLDEA